jgi:SpoVK/Ycf46/Vps4 family AAA+-type ATPase
LPKKLVEGNKSSGGAFIGLRLLPEEKKDEEDEKKNRNIPKVTFSEIGGLGDVLIKIREIIELPMKLPELFIYLGIIPHKGILLFGPPGCGKTLIAKAIAHEINAHFINIKGPELLSKYHGQSEENLRNIFDEAKKLQPSIIFFDEIDAIAQNRSSDETLRFDSRFVNQLLTLMDGVEDYGNIRVIASTNRPELLDNALLRPGRFDYQLEISKPTLQGCKEIFNIYTKKMPIDNKFNTELFPEKLFGFTGADIAFIIRESAYNCIRRNIDIEETITKEQDVNYETLIIDENDFELALKMIKGTDK